MDVGQSNAGPTFALETVRQSLRASLHSGKSTGWWYGNQHLYEVFVQPIYFGGPSENRLLGSLVFASVWQAATARAGRAEARRQDAAVYVDEAVRHEALQS